VEALKTPNSSKVSWSIRISHIPKCPRKFMMLVSPSLPAHSKPQNPRPSTTSTSLQLKASKNFTSWNKNISLTWSATFRKMAATSLFASGGSKMKPTISCFRTNCQPSDGLVVSISNSLPWLLVPALFLASRKSPLKSWEKLAAFARCISEQETRRCWWSNNAPMPKQSLFWSAEAPRWLLRRQSVPFTMLSASFPLSSDATASSGEEVPLKSPPAWQSTTSLTPSIIPNSTQFVPSPMPSNKSPWPLPKTQASMPWNPWPTPRESRQTATSLSSASTACRPATATWKNKRSSRLFFPRRANSNWPHRWSRWSSKSTTSSSQSPADVYTANLLSIGVWEGG